MTLSHLARVLLVVALASAGACTNTPTKSGIPWWPQGPGNPPGSEQSAAAEQATQVAPTTAPAAPAATAPAAAAEPRTQASAAAPQAAAPGGDAQATRYGDLLFLSGQIAADSGGVEQQTHAVMQKIGAILDSNRLTMANIVQVTVQLADIKDLSAMDAAYASHFRSTPPARSVAEAAQLPGNARVQISVIAGR